MSIPRRRPIEITRKILEFVKKNPEAKKTDLVYIVGNDVQYNHYVGEFLIKKGFLEEEKDDRRYFYKLTNSGEDFYKLLKNDYLVVSLLKIGGRTLRDD